jgi:biotin-(acetyl-CoA carboxylase) ligase
MARAAESATGLSTGTVRLKGPNDLVVATGPDELRKLGGVLGESDGLGTGDPRVVVGIGLNVDWAASAFPRELVGAMTSLRVVAGDEAVDRGEVLDGFLERLEPGIRSLRDGGFDAADWAARQVTTGQWLRIERSDGHETVFGAGVDAVTGALLVKESPESPQTRPVFVGEITHVRLGGATAVMV